MVVSALSGRAAPIGRGFDPVTEADVGAAQAAEAIQQKDKAAGYYAQLLKNCEGSHSDRPELERAKTLVAQK